MDLFATVAALTVQENTASDSINMLPALLEDPSHSLREHLVISARQEKRLAIRQGKWAYLPFQGGAGFQGKKLGQSSFAGAPAVTFTGRENSDIQKGRIKKDAPSAQLYDLESDLSQTTNLYHEYPDVVGHMKTLLDAFRSGC